MGMNCSLSLDDPLLTEGFMFGSNDERVHDAQSSKTVVGHKVESVLMIESPHSVIESNMGLEFRKVKMVF